jgi:cobalamin biosynthesis protein CobT
MEFWGVEVKPGETVKCQPGDDKYIHLSQASIGETKKPTENVPLFVKCDDKKLVVGTLSGEKCAQIQYDLVFEKDFELSHSSKNASVHFCGYKTIVSDDADHMFDDDSMSDESEEEEEPIEAVPLKAPAANGKPKSSVEKAKVEKAKAEGSKKAGASKPKTDDKANKSKNVLADEDDSDESEDDDDDSDEGDEDDSDVEPKGLKMMELDVDEDDDDDDEEDDDEDESDEEEKEATPQKTDSKKRPLKDAQKTPSQENKKAKLVSPAGAQKTDGKKGGHVATPHPAKQAPKTPAASNDKSKQKPQTPKSGGSVACKSCSKTFNSENALQSHAKAKHV